MKTTKPDASQMALEGQKYLQPSELCNFDRHPEIGAKARALTEGCHGQEQKFQRVTILAGGAHELIQPVVDNPVEQLEVRIL